jgi:SnoaL-like domain
MTDERELRLLATADRIEIGELMHRYAWAIDHWEWSLLDDVFAEDAEGDFSSVKQYVGGDGIARGRAAIVAWLKGSLAKFPGVLHFMTNQLVSVAGDEAHITTYMHVMHLPMGGIYHCAAARTPRGWRIRRFCLEERSFREAAERLERHMASFASA